MFDQPEFEDVLAHALDMIDRILAECEVPLWERPLRAAREFVTYFIIKIRFGEEEREPGAFNEYAGPQKNSSFSGRRCPTEFQAI